MKHASQFLIPLRVAGLLVVALSEERGLKHLLFERRPEPYQAQQEVMQGMEKGPTVGVGSQGSNRCSELDMTVFDKGRACGSPLSLPCFDYSRCNSSQDKAVTGPRIYVYDIDCSLADSADLSQGGEVPGGAEGERLDTHFIDWYWRKAAKDAGLLADTYDSACLYIHVTRKGAPCATDTPQWNEGRNHVMVDFSDSTRDNRPEVADSFAMEAASNLHTCFYRSGYDISMPLPPLQTFPQLAAIPPLDREYFLTMKGSVYLSKHGEEERKSLVGLHDEPAGVITAMRCHRREDFRSLEIDAYCDELEERYEDHDYDSLMNTTFGIVPAGRSVGTYRLGEVMSAGAIPVFVARDLVPPFREQFDWPAFSFVFSPDQVGSSMLRVLRAVPQQKLREMQRKSLKASRKIFGDQAVSFDFSDVAHRMVDIVKQRVGHH